MVFLSFCRCTLRNGHGLTRHSTPAQPYARFLFSPLTYLTCQHVSTPSPLRRLVSFTSLSDTNSIVARPSEARRRAAQCQGEEGWHDAHGARLRVKIGDHWGRAERLAHSPPARHVPLVLEVSIAKVVQEYRAMKGPHSDGAQPCQPIFGSLVPSEIQVTMFNPGQAFRRSDQHSCTSNGSTTASGDEITTLQRIAAHKRPLRAE